MPALAAPPKRKGGRTPGTWTPDQARSMRVKAAEGRRKAAEKRKIAKLGFVNALDATLFDPIADVQARISIAARTSASPATLDRLASTLDKLTRAKSRSSSNYTPTPCSPVRQPTPATPQASQAVDPKHDAVQTNFAQYTEPLVGQAKESLNQAGVGAPVGGGGAARSGGGGVIEHNTRGPNSDPLRSPDSNKSFEATDRSVKSVSGASSKLLCEATVEELEDRLRELRSQSKPSVQVKGGLVGPVPSSGPGSIGASPKEGMEKFLVGGVWVWGTRKK